MKFNEKTLFAWLAAALFITACAEAPKPSPPQPAPDPVAEGERLMRSMSDTLARSKAFTFESNEQLEVVSPSGEKRMVHFTREVTVRRPNAIFFELHGKGDTALEVAAYYDGRTLTLSEKPDGAWAQTAVPGTIDWMLDDVARRFGLPVPIGDVIYSSPYEAFIGSSTRGGLAGRETIDGVACAKLDYADDLLQIRVWLPSSGPTLPHRIELTYKQAPVPLVAQINFTNWKLDVPVADSTFAFQTPQGRKPSEFGDFVAGVVSRIVPAGRPSASPGVPKGKTGTSPTPR